MSGCEQATSSRCHSVAAAVAVCCSACCSVCIRHARPRCSCPLCSLVLSAHSRCGTLISAARWAASARVQCFGSRMGCTVWVWSIFCSRRHLGGGEGPSPSPFPSTHLPPPYSMHQRCTWWWGVEPVCLQSCTIEGRYVPFACHVHAPRLHSCTQSADIMSTLTCRAAGASLVRLGKSL